jgi:hypothetical protein
VSIPAPNKTGVSEDGWRSSVWNLPNRINLRYRTKGTAHELSVFEKTTRVQVIEGEGEEGRRFCEIMIGQYAKGRV